MSEHEREPAEAQREHGRRAYGEHPGMYGEEPSEPAVHAAEVFRAAGAVGVLELRAGHGRDALYFAREGFTVRATDFSPTGLDRLRDATRAQSVEERVTTTVHDVREPLPAMNVPAVPDEAVRPGTGRASPAGPASARSRAPRRPRWSCTVPARSR